MSDTNPWQSCDPWVSAETLVVAAACDVTGDTVDALAAQAAIDAGALLRLMAGGQIDGICTYAVRPVIPRLGGFPSQSCTCAAGVPCTAAAFPLAPPVREVVSVTLHGETLTEGTDYALHGDQFLMRLSDPTTRVRRHWPTAQRLDLPATERGTMLVVYRSGIEIPGFAVDAAVELGSALLRNRLRLDTTLDPAVTSVSTGNASLSLEPAARRLRETATAEVFPSVIRFIERVNPKGARHAGDGIYSFDTGFGVAVPVPD